MKTDAKSKTVFEATGAAGSTVTVFPVPDEEVAPRDLEMTVDGTPVGVYCQRLGCADGHSYFASFDTDAEEVEVRIASKRSLAHVKVLPRSAGIAPCVDGDTMTFKAKPPFQLSIERDGRNSALALFANRPERDAPKPGDPGVIYFGPGVHKPERVDVNSGQTVYLAGGAVVKGGIVASGTNIAIRGRGVLCGADWPGTRGGPTPYPISINGATNVVVEGITVRCSWGWTVVAKNCDGLVIDNLKICCANMICDDGIDLVNTRHVVIRNTFVRTMDDCICAKGMDPGVDAEWRALGQPCEDIEVSNCVLWSDAANVFRIGFESMAQAMRRIRVCDIDVIHLSAVVRDVSHFYANCAVNLQPTRGMPMSDLIFEDIRFDDVPEHSVLIKAHLDRCSFDGQRDTTTGSLSGCVFRNFSFPPGVDGGVISLLGAGPANTIENVAFENIGPHRDMRIGDSPKNIRIETVPTVSHP